MKTFIILIFTTISFHCLHSQSIIKIDENYVRKFPKDFLGINAEITMGDCIRQAGFLDTVKLMKPLTIRFPNGTPANYWDWQRGWYLKNTPREKYNNIPVIYKLGDQKRFHDIFPSIKTLFVLNLLTSNKEYQFEFLDSARSKYKIPVELIEMGNEFYLDDTLLYPDNVNKYPIPEVYGDTIRQWLKFFRKELSLKNATYALIGASVSAYDNINLPPNRIGDWNINLINHLKKFPEIKENMVITLHIYGRGETVVDLDNNRILWYAFNSIERMKTLDLDPIKKSAPEMKVWITEFNMNFTTLNSPVLDTWLHGLYTAIMTSSFFDFEQIEKISAFNLIARPNNTKKNTIYPLMFSGDNDFDQPLLPTKKYSLTATGYAHAIIAQTASGADSVKKLQFGNNPLQTAKLFNYSPTFNSYLGYQFIGPNKNSLLLMNLSNDTATFDVSAFYPNQSKFSYLIYTADPQKKITNIDNHLTKKTGNTINKIKVPPYSISHTYQNNEKISGIEDDNIQKNKDFCRNISVFPIPASESIQIDLKEINNNREASATLINSFGQTVYEAKNHPLEISSHILNISTSDLLSGIYYLKTNGESDCTIKIIVNK